MGSGDWEESREEHECPAETYDISFQHVSFGYEEGKDVSGYFILQFRKGRTFGILAERAAGSLQ